RCEIAADRAGQQALEEALSGMVRRRLVALEAAAEGVGVEVIEARMIADAAAIGAEDVDRFYEENKARIGQPKEQIEDQIRLFLEQREEQRAREAAFAELEARWEVDYRLEPLRFDVEAEGFAATGPATAPVTIVEFSDFECPYCARLLPTLEAAKERYGDQLRIVYRHFPLSIHANAQKAAEASLCAGEQGRFWDMHDLLFAEQGSLDGEGLKDKAARLELAEEVFAECLDSGRHFEAVQEDLRAGAEAGVDGTPAMFVNGRFLSGAVAFETLSEIVDDELARARRE
ncbi:MAG: DsbA family protein, partial [Thermoanaerobaculia bacterium]|nr:DsbA family protein [Thermoanaerobaculia bacterium]